MIKLFLIILIFATSCSKDPKSSLWNKKKIDHTENQLKSKKINQKKEILKKNFNKDLELNFSNKITKNSFEKLDNNYGRKNYSNIPIKNTKYKFKKIKNFIKYEANLIIDNTGLIFFDGKGSLFRYDSLGNIIWKQNHYSKQEIKSNLLLNINEENNFLIISDNLAKYYRIDLSTGNIIWSKASSSPFNSQIKIYKDKFFVVDLENKIHCFSVKNGKKIWSFQTENFFIKSNKKLSIAIDNGIVYFNNSIGDITALNSNTGDLIWQIPTQNNFVYGETILLKNSDLVIHKDSIFFSNNKNQFYSINKNNGIINWKQDINSQVRPVIVSETIFTITNEGFLMVIDSNNGNIIRSTDQFVNFNDKKRNFIEPIGISLGVGKIYTTLNNGYLQISEINSGQIIKSIKIDNKIISSPFIYNKKLFVIKDDAIIEYD